MVVGNSSLHPSVAAAVFVDHVPALAALCGEG